MILVILQKMRFYCSIHIVYGINEETGQPKRKKIIIPEEYRRFISIKGRWLEAYIRKDKRENILRDTAKLVYEKFPDWGGIEDEFPGCIELSKWNEDDHDSFEEAMKWFSDNSKNGIEFMVYWGTCS